MNSGKKNFRNQPNRRLVILDREASQLRPCLPPLHPSSRRHGSRRSPSLRTCLPPPRPHLSATACLPPPSRQLDSSTHILPTRLPPVQQSSRLRRHETGSSSRADSLKSFPQLLYLSMPHSDYSFFKLPRNLQELQILTF
ncbi:hypothetical protein GUJ93_ZPchr0013g34437 [Zizania palustris]|uniref:Uncharacterized protein n=1 Tax=Zizania palustris TaxID=103762 RepID=A0A8J6BY71_ZIZPA|nr:hypothetical protein GUJ93_ZPchr0013g34437 [Zizania palustris]